MRVRTSTDKPKGAAAGSGKKKGVRAVPLTLPAVSKSINRTSKEFNIDQNKIDRANKNIAQHDLEQELGVQTASAGELKTLSAEVTKAAKLAETIENLEAMVKGHKEELHGLTNRIIPDIMRAAHTSLHKTDAGVRVELKDFINGSLPKDEVGRNTALKWLEDNGAKDLIKTSIALALGRGQKEEAKKIKVALDKLGATYTQKEDVHAQSLYAFARERMKDGKELPTDLLGLYVGQVAKIELPDKT